MSKKINNNTQRLLISNFLSLGGRTVFKIFLNIYLWKETNDIQLLAMFNILFLLGHGLSFVLLSPIVKLGHRRIINFFSYLGFIISYLVMIFLGVDIINYIYIVGFVFGIFNGSYYVNYGVNQFDLTTFKNRGNFEGIKKSLKIMTKMIFPALFGLIIGFYNIQLAFIVGIFLFIVSYFIGDVKFDFSVGKTHYKSFIQKAFINKKILYSILGSFFFTLSFSMILLEVLIPLIIFNEVGSEVKLGFSISFLSILSILIIYLFGKLIDYKHYNKSLVGICIMYIISLLGLIFSNNFSITLFFSSFVISLIALYGIGVSVITNNSLHTFKNYDNYRVEFIVLKEIGYVLGRMLSFVLMYFSKDLSQDSMKYIFYTLMIFSIVSTLFLIKINIHEIEE